ncbi:uteroglobin-like [Dipodomys merriami]|uniref:uteroglobin-like n=1 Tax=Dipodomys merriami TaxID=94247 RepID=UPI003855736B
MKLATVLALAALAMCCSSASAEICPKFLYAFEKFLLGTLSSYEGSLKPFHPEQAILDSALQMKKLVDTLPQETRSNVMKLADNILKSPLCASDIGAQSPGSVKGKDA